ncbi:MAG: hypothetical protein DYH03_13600 [Nitrospira sp. NTP1]|nr:hypothetical protein [Nitrospira sp. NTP1]
MTQTGSHTDPGWYAGIATLVLLSALLLAVVPSAQATEESKVAPAAQKDESKPETVKKDVQGPATSAPREIYDMLEQRKRLLDKRETAVRGSETHLLELKAELEQIVTRHEQAVEAEKKRRQAAQAKGAGEAEKVKTPAKATPAVNVNQVQLAKIYEAMPAEEAAARLERMPERKALEVLRLLKGKSAGAILAEVKPERAARLTEQLLTTP